MDFDSTAATRYGLFACYRKPAAAPGPPACYLAQMLGMQDDLVWPGTVFGMAHPEFVTHPNPAAVYSPPKSKKVAPSP